MRPGVSLGSVALAAVCAGCGARSPLGDLGSPEASAATTTGPGTTPSQPHASRLALGYGLSCAVMTDGTVRCWGYDGFHQLGRAGSSPCAGPAAALGPCAVRPTPVPALAGVARLAIGATHACALAEDGAVRCWGTGPGAGAESGAVVEDPTLVSAPGSPVVDLAADLDNTCVLHADGTVSCWGDDAYGQLGLGSTTGVGEVSQLAMGHNFTCGRMADQTVRCSGLDDEGQLGNGAMSGEEAHQVPSAVVGLSGITQIVAGYDHACALTSDGTVSCWGSELRLVPWQVTSIEGLADVSQVAAGEAFTCALRTDGSVACWGVNLEGEIGDGTTAFRGAPTQVAGLRGVVQLAVRGFHACALTDSSAVYCWGLNAHGEVGDGTTVDRPVARRIDL